MANIVYQRPIGRRKYLSISKHFAHARNGYSKWLDINIERNTFDCADYGNFSHLVSDESWTDSNGNLWGFLQNFPDVGVDGEQFGFFPVTQNTTDEWHGYPIIPFVEKELSQELLQSWVDDQVIDEDDVTQIIHKRKV